MKKAIQDRRPTIGMDREEVVAAIGKPEHKVRERDAEGNEIEDWIYGQPPSKTVFVRFQGEQRHQRPPVPAVTLAVFNKFVRRCTGIRVEAFLPSCRLPFEPPPSAVLSIHLIQFPVFAVRGCRPRSPQEKSVSSITFKHEQEESPYGTFKSRAALLALAAIGLASAGGIGCSGTVRVLR